MDLNCAGVSGSRKVVGVEVEGRWLDHGLVVGHGRSRVEGERILYRRVGRDLRKHVSTERIRTLIFHFKWFILEEGKVNTYLEEDSHDLDPNCASMVDPNLVQDHNDLYLVLSPSHDLVPTATAVVVAEAVPLNLSNHREEAANLEEGEAHIPFDHDLYHTLQPHPHNSSRVPTEARYHISLHVHDRRIYH